MSVIPNTRGNPQASDIAVQTALPMVGTASREDGQTALSNIDAELAKLFEDRNATLVGGGLITYLGTTVQFTQPLELHLNSKVAGGAPTVIDLTATTRTISATGRMIYAVVNRGAGTAVVTDDAPTLPAVTSTNQEVFLIAKRVDSPEPLQRLYFRTGMALDQGQTARLGSSGSGSGSGNPLLETLKNQLVDSPYELVTPNIIATEEDDQLDPSTTAAFDIVTKTVKFTSAVQFALSINSLDSAEFLAAAGLDVDQIDLSLFWNTTVAVPTNGVYSVSRGGDVSAIYQTVTMERIGTTDTFRGTLRFTDETTHQVLSSNGTGAALLLLDGTTQQQLAQRLVLADTKVLRQLKLEADALGTPVGNIYVQIQSNSAGSPSGTVLAESNPINVASIVDGTLTVTMPKLVLVAGTYHIVIRSDAQYKTNSFGSNAIRFLENAAGAGGRSTHNGTTWTTSGSAIMRYSFEGRTLDLRVKILSNTASEARLDGYGIFYNVQDAGMVGATRKNQRFTFNSVTDNLSTFAITAFNPNPDTLSCYYVESGQVFKAPSFVLDGNTVRFPANTFDNGGVSATVTLIFDQNTGGAFDNSDSNSRLMGANHLGSTNGADDRSLAGRGIILRNAAGTLVELAVDASNNITISSVP